MIGYNFTESVRKCLLRAREESGKLQHEYVGTEHMLLGIMRVPESTAMVLLRELSVDTDAIRRGIESIVKKGSRTHTGPDLPYTSRAKKVLELTTIESRELGHSFVGTEHLILGLLREEKGIAAQVLTDAGLRHDTLRMELVRLLSSGVSTEPMYDPSVRRPADVITQSSGELEPVLHDASSVHVSSTGMHIGRLGLALVFLGGVVVGWLLHLL